MSEKIKQRLKKQKTPGVVYTPRAVADYLVSRTLGQAKPASYQILDPACGEGVFLSAAFAHYPQSQLTGVDIDSQALTLARQQLPQQASLLCGDFFSQAFPEQTFDFILGNPPYITEVRGQKERFQAFKQLAPQYYTAKMDLADAFVHRSLDLLKPGGQLAFVLPAYWLQRQAAEKLRTRIWQECQIQEVWIFDEQALFRDAPGHHSALVILTKTEKTQPDQKRTCRMGKPFATQPNTKDLLSGEVRLIRGKFRVTDRQTQAILDQMSENAWYLKPEEIQQGVILPSPDIFLIDKSIVPQNESACLKPFYTPKDLSHGNASAALIYADAAFVNNIANFPTLKTHLDRNASKNTSAHAPYGLHRARQPDWFEAGTVRLYAPRQVFTPRFYLITDTAYVNEGVNIIRPDLPKNWSFEKLQACLSSPWAWFWFYHHNRKGKRLQIDKIDLLNFPLPTENYSFTQRDLDIVEDFLGRLAKKR